MGDYISLMMFPTLIAFIIAGFPIAFSMIIVAVGFGLVLFGDDTAYQLISKIEDTSFSSVLSAIPLFIFMGAMLEKSGIANRLFDAVHLWTQRIPGGLGVGAVIMCTLFAASSGVVGATEAVIGMLAVPAMLKYHYNKSLISGTICASGSLGTAIPPSITVIVLGPVAGVSVGSLFAGLLIPGFLMATFFLIYIVGAVYFKLEMAPKIVDDKFNVSLAEKLRITLVALILTLSLICIVLGSILMGAATPTEAAACGALSATIIAIIYRNLSFEILWNSARQTMNISAMILMIVIGGSMFAGVFFASGGMGSVQSFLVSHGLSPWAIIGPILLIAFIAGFVLDLISVIIIVPVAMPLVRTLGFDEIWFSVAFLVVLQTSYLTPPLAPAIFYLRAISPPEITLKHMYIGVIPFIIVQLVVLVLILAFPSLALWAPDALSGPYWK